MNGGGEPVLKHGPNTACGGNARERACLSSHLTCVQQRGQRPGDWDENKISCDTAPQGVALSWENLRAFGPTGTRGSYFEPSSYNSLPAIVRPLVSTHLCEIYKIAVVDREGLTQRRKVFRADSFRLCVFAPLREAHREF